ncbi:MAG: hypothetical protein ABJA87_02090 [bacterium]
MSDVDQVLARMETDLGFRLAVRSDPRRALAAFDLDDEERAAFDSSGTALWSLVLRHTSRTGVETPDGGLPPPPPPFTVNYSHADWRTDPISLRADEDITATLQTIRSSDGATRARAVAELMDRIG